MVKLSGIFRGNGLLVSTALVLAALLLPGPCLAGETPVNVVLFIGDGMGQAQVRAGGIHLEGPGGGVSFEAFPHRAMVTTHSAGGEITDSAAAATAMATGVKVANGVVSVAWPGDGSPLPTMVERFSSLGKATGVVTTAYLVHSTPAAFAAHETSRYRYRQIARDYLDETRPDVLLGGSRYIGAAMARAAGYTVVTDAAGLADVAGTGGDRVPRVCGLFGRGHLPFVLDGRGDLPGLVEMTLAALDMLGEDPDGFFLLVEAGRIDHAGHDLDGERLAAEVAELSRAVEAAVEWAGDRDDTLIIVTADHETGGMEVGPGPGGRPVFSFTTDDHTGADVGVYATGPGASRFTGTIDNTEIFRFVMEGMGE